MIGVHQGGYTQGGVHRVGTVHLRAGLSGWLSAQCSIGALDGTLEPPSLVAPVPLAERARRGRPAPGCRQLDQWSSWQTAGRIGPALSSTLGRHLSAQLSPPGRHWRPDSSRQQLGSLVGACSARCTGRYTQGVYQGGISSMMHSGTVAPRPP